MPDDKSQGADPWASYKQPMKLPFTPLNTKGDLPKAEEFRANDKRDCDCPMPMVSRKQHRALGRGAGIRFCCMARALESFMELPQGTLYFWAEFKPDWVWDVSEYVEDGEGGMVQRGFPPPWLLKRFAERGTELVGLEDFHGPIPELKGRNNGV